MASASETVWGKHNFAAQFRYHVWRMITWIRIPQSQSLSQYLMRCAWMQHNWATLLRIHLPIVHGWSTLCAKWRFENYGTWCREWVASALARQFIVHHVWCKFKCISWNKVRNCCINVPWCVHGCKFNHLLCYEVPTASFVTHLLSRPLWPTKMFRRYCSTLCGPEWLDWASTSKLEIVSSKYHKVSRSLQYIAVYCSMLQYVAVHCR